MGIRKAMSKLTPPRMRRTAAETKLRDEFAKAVLPAAMKNFYEAGEAWDGHDDVAAHCYSVADSMLEARK
jgi:hypothetical protein